MVLGSWLGAPITITSFLPVCNESPAPRIDTLRQTKWEQQNVFCQIGLLLFHGSNDNWSLSFLQVFHNKQVSVTHMTPRDAPSRSQMVLSSNFHLATKSYALHATSHRTILGCSHSLRVFGKEIFETVTFSKRTPPLDLRSPSKGHRWALRKGTCWSRIRLASLCSHRSQTRLSFPTGPQGPQPLSDALPLPPTRQSWPFPFE